jgi:tight adherence protein C
VELFILGLTFLSASLVVSAMFPRAAAVVRTRIDDYLEAEAPGRVPSTPWLALPIAQRFVVPALRAIGRLALRATPQGVVANTRRKLEAAGSPKHLGIAEFLALRVVSPAVIIPLGWILLRLFQLPHGIQILGMLCAVIVGLWLPDGLLDRAAQRRQSKIRRALPDVVDLLVISVEAGVGFDGAMQRVVDKWEGPLSDELSRVLEEIRLGRSRGDALKDMARRTGVPDLESFVAAVYQAEALGVPIAKVLHVQAQVARERRSQRAREAGAKLPVKLLFPLVFFIFPAVFAVILGPAAMRFPVLLKILASR